MFCTSWAKIGHRTFEIAREPMQKKRSHVCSIGEFACWPVEDEFPYHTGASFRYKGMGGLASTQSEDPFRSTSIKDGLLSPPFGPNYRAD
jgi:hypothetical protein